MNERPIPTVPPTVPSAVASTAMSIAPSTARFAEVADLPVMVDLLTAGRIVGVGRTTAYKLAQAGEFPCPVVRVGGVYKVPTVGLLRLLGLHSA